MFNDETTTTYPTKKLLSLLIGDHHFCSIPHDLAEILKVQTGNKPESGFFIQTEAGPDDGDRLEYPRVWHYRFWANDSERRERARKYSEQQRELRFIFEANIKKLARIVSDETDIPLEMARTTAYKLLTKKKWRQIRELMQDETLYTRIEELP